MSSSTLGSVSPKHMKESALFIVSLGFKAFVEYFALENSLELLQFPESSLFSKISFVFRNVVDFCIKDDFYIRYLVLISETYLFPSLNSLSANSSFKFPLSTLSLIRPTKVCFLIHISLIKDIIMKIFELFDNKYQFLRLLRYIVLELLQ